VGFEQQIDQWGDYYLAAAGAAAVLLGLVFIALSLHLEKAEAPGVPVLGLGGQALINLIYVLLLSLGMLVPYRPPVLPGIAVLAVAVVGLNDSITTLRRARRVSEPHLTVSEVVP
jgi:peptidoglycan/LPS O-acetylase OafA/YrhL